MNADNAFDICKNVENTNELMPHTSARGVLKLKMTLFFEAHRERIYIYIADNVRANENEHDKPISNNHSNYLGSTRQLSERFLLCIYIYPPQKRRNELIITSR